MDTTIPSTATDCLEEREPFTEQYNAIYANTGFSSFYNSIPIVSSRMFIFLHFNDSLFQNPRFISFSFSKPSSTYAFSLHCTSYSFPMSGICTLSFNISYISLSVLWNDHFFHTTLIVITRYHSYTGFIPFILFRIGQM